MRRCEEFKRVIAIDPEAANRPDPDGNTPLLTAIFDASRLAHAGLGHGECASAVLESGAERNLPATIRNSLGKDVEIKTDHSLVEELLDLLTKEWGPRWYNEDLGHKLRMFGLEIKKFRDLKSEDLIAGQT